MAKIYNPATGESILLRANHVFGRDGSTVNSVFSEKDISNVHASLRWHGSCWFLYDHSRNGTWLNGELLQHSSATLTINSAIRFGSSQKTTWTLVDASPPKAMLVPLHAHEAVIELKQLHVLPTPENPQVCIFLADNHWSHETEHGVVPLQDGEIITCGDSSWQYFSPQAADTTIGLNQYRHMTIEDILFSFQSSLDEEHVEATITYHERDIPLQERVHHYLLLTLARPAGRG